MCGLLQAVSGEQCFEGQGGGASVDGLASVTWRDRKVQLNGGAFGVRTAQEIRLRDSVLEIPTAGCLGHRALPAAQYVPLLLSRALPPFGHETPR